MSEETNGREVSGKPTLWVVSELYYPEETSTGYYLTRIAEGLADNARVRVLCAQPTYSKRGTRAAKHETHNGVEIFRVASTTLDKNVIPFRVINMLTLGVATFFMALRHFKKGDRVLVVTTPPSTPFVIALASLTKGAGYTLLIHDSYPELLVAVGKTKANSLFVRLMSHANRWLYKYSSKIIVVSRDMLELTKRKTAGLDIQVVNIPNWAEMEKGSETDLIISEENIGWSVAPQKPDDMLVTIREILQSTEYLTEMAGRARSVAIHYFSPADAIEKYRKALTL